MEGAGADLLGIRDAARRDRDRAAVAPALDRAVGEESAGVNAAGGYLCGVGDTFDLNRRRAEIVPIVIRSVAMIPYSVAKLTGAV